MSTTTVKKEINSLQDILKPIEKELHSFDLRLLNEISPNSRSLCTILQDIFSAGGKRVRPAISFLVYKAILVSLENLQGDEEKLFLIAEISELIHTASLVHDDIIDNSLIRRGKPTTNSKWDNAVTVISGDFMFSRAAVNLGKVAINEVTSLYARVLEDLCDGEIWQVEKKYSTDIDWDYYYQKTFKKTASLFEASALAPAILLSLEAEQQKALSDYGTNLGLAFQFIDDVLDFSSNTEKLGKPAFADLRDGQITMPVLLCLEKSRDDMTKHEEIKSLIELIRDSASEAEIESAVKKVYAYILEYDALHASLEKAKDLIAKAKSDLSFLTDSEYKKSLIDLADFIIDREF